MDLNKTLINVPVMDADGKQVKDSDGNPVFLQIAPATLADIVYCATTNSAGETVYIPLTTALNLHGEDSGAHQAAFNAYGATVDQKIAAALASGGAAVDETAVRAIVSDAIANFDISVDDTVVRNAVKEEMKGTDLGQIDQRLDALEAAFNVGGTSSTPYPGVSAIIVMEVPDDDFFLVSGIHDRVNKMLKI